jgi:hypothetical protein
MYKNMFFRHRPVKLKKNVFEQKILHFQKKIKNKK